MAKSIFNEYGYKHIMGLILVAVLISSCAYRGSKADRRLFKIEPQNISTPKLSNQVNVRVSANIWDGSPKNLKNHIVPFYIEMQNNTDKNIIISQSDFVLFDENRNQYNALPPERAANIVKSANKKRFYSYPRISIGVGTSFHHDNFHYFGHHRFPFYRPYHHFDDYPYNGYRSSYEQQDLEDIYTKSLAHGVIRPGATLSGYVFFNKISKNTKELTFEVGYTVKEVNTAHRLDFHFDLIEIYYK